MMYDPPNRRLQTLIESLSTRIIRHGNNALFRAAPWVTVGTLDKDVRNAGLIAKGTSSALTKKQALVRSGSMGGGMYGVRRLMKSDEKMHRRGSRLRQRVTDPYLDSV